MGQGRLSEPWGPGEEDVVQGAFSLLSGFYPGFKVVGDPILPDELVESSGPEGPLGLIALASERLEDSLVSGLIHGVDDTGGGRRSTLSCQQVDLFRVIA